MVTNNAADIRQLKMAGVNGVQTVSYEEQIQYNSEHIVQLENRDRQLENRTNADRLDIRNNTDQIQNTNNQLEQVQNHYRQLQEKFEKLEKEFQEFKKGHEREHQESKRRLKKVEEKRDD